MNHKTELTPEIAKHLETLSKNPLIQQVLKNRGTKTLDQICLRHFLSFHYLGDEMILQGGASGVKHYLENAVRYASPDCIPHNDDVLKARRKSTGVLEVYFITRFPLSHYA